MLFEFLEMMIAFFGHTATHKPQPLHRSVSIMILPAILITYIVFNPRFHRGISMYDPHCSSFGRYCKVKRQPFDTLERMPFMQKHLEHIVSSFIRI